MTSEPVRVVCAVIEQGGRVLVAQRPPHKDLPLQWEFPGGKIEPGETAADALQREIREELGCDLAELSPLPSSIHHYPRISVEMVPFAAQLAAGSPAPDPAEHAAIRWIPPAELLTIDLAAADVPIVSAYLAAGRSGQNKSNQAGSARESAGT